MHRFDLEHCGIPLGWALMGTGTVMSWLADHGFGLFGVALGLFGAWIQWKTYRMRAVEHVAKMKAMEAKA